MWNCQWEWTHYLKLAVEMHILCFSVAVLSLGWSRTAAPTELTAQSTSEPKFSSWLWTSGDRGRVCSCWEPWERSLGCAGLSSEGGSPPCWFLRTKACSDSRALPKLPWCRSCCRIHLDSPGGTETPHCEITAHNTVFHTTKQHPDSANIPL